MLIESVFALDVGAAARSIFSRAIYRTYTHLGPNKHYSFTGILTFWEITQENGFVTQTNISTCIHLELICYWLCIQCHWVCIQCHWLHTVSLTAYSVTDCIQCHWLHTVSLTTYSVTDCIPCHWLHTVSLTAYSVTDSAYSVTESAYSIADCIQCH